MLDFFEKYPVVEKVIAAGVSGGADSLALVLRLKEWGDLKGVKIIALTVNHHLRPEADAEADYVAGLMMRYGVEHHILHWKSGKLSTGIEEAARKARYDLISKWCADNGVAVLATGHHRRDQAETFLLRLIRGSGVDGLSSILPVSERNGLTIIRPQLEDNPDELRNYLKKAGVKWMEDASNQNEDFLRVRIRRFLPILETELGLSETRLAATAAILGKTRSYLEAEANKFIERHVENWGSAGVSLELESWLGLHGEMQYRVLAFLVKAVGKRDYAPTSEEMLRLCSRLAASGFKGCTLGGCEIFPFKQKIWIVPELKNPGRLLKKEWDEFLQTHPEYAKPELPYKLRRGLVVLD